MSWWRPSPAEPEPWLADEVYRRAEGNPLFVEELLSDGSLTCRAAGVTARPAAGGRAAAARGDRGSAPAASASGQRSGHPLLAAVTGLGSDDLERTLRPAVAANVLIAGQSGYAFRHALIREAIYDDPLLASAPGCIPGSPRFWRR